MVLEAHRVRCTRRLAANAKRNVKFLLSPEKTARSIARIAFPNARTPAAANQQNRDSYLGTRDSFGFLIFRGASLFFCLSSPASGVLRQKVPHPFDGLGHTRQGDPHRVPLGKIIHEDRGVATPVADLECRDLA